MGLAKSLLQAIARPKTSATVYFNPFNAEKLRATTLARVSWHLKTKKSVYKHAKYFVRQCGKFVRQGQGT